MTVQRSNLNEEQLEGYDAYQRGNRPQDNPYPWETAQQECRDWIKGFAAARTDKALTIRAGAPQ